MEILCRIDPTSSQPVVFVTDTIHDGRIQAWKGEGKSEYVPLDYYHMTGPLSAADERVLCERFVRATSAAGVVKIRHRLPRTSRPLPNLLDNAKVELLNGNHAESIVKATIVTTPTATPRAPRISKAAAKKAKALARKAAAKPAVAAPAPSPAPVESSAPSVSQATPADVMNAIAALGAEFNGKLTALASLLQPAAKK